MTQTNREQIINKWIELEGSKDLRREELEVNAMSAYLMAKKMYEDIFGQELTVQKYVAL